MSIALKPRELPRRSITVVIPGDVNSCHDSFGRLLLTTAGKVYRRRGYTEAWESITAAIPATHDIEREGNGAVHVRGKNAGGAWVHLVSGDGGSTWHTLT